MASFVGDGDTETMESNVLPILCTRRLGVCMYLNSVVE